MWFVLVVSVYTGRSCGFHRIHHSRRISIIIDHRTTDIHKTRSVSRSLASLSPRGVCVGVCARVCSTCDTRLHRSYRIARLCSSVRCSLTHRESLGSSLTRAPSIARCGPLGSAHSIRMATGSPTAKSPNPRHVGPCGCVTYAHCALPLRKPPPRNHARVSTAAYPPRNHCTVSHRSAGLHSGSGSSRSGSGALRGALLRGGRRRRRRRGEVAGLDSGEVGEERRKVAVKLVEPFGD